MRERPMIIPMPTTARPQQCYDHRLRNLAQRTGDVTVATDLGVPRSTARGWRGADGRGLSGCGRPHGAGTPTGGLEAAAPCPEARGALRLALALLRTSGFSLTGERLPDGRAKIRILRAVDRAHEYLPLRAVLRFLRVSPSRFHGRPSASPTDCAGVRCVRCERAVHPEAAGHTRRHVQTSARLTTHRLTTRLRSLKLQ